MGYQNLFTFIYSPRKGTAAAKMPDSITHQQKVEWFGELQQLQKQVGNDQYAKMLGQVVRVLPEGPGRSGEGYLTGRDDFNRVIDFVGDETLIGQFVYVKIDTVLGFAAQGHLIDPPQNNK